jgi:CubicO group peptidase (beta-lactamase class C family)
MSLIPLPPQPVDVPWPTQAWPLGELAAGADAARLNGLVEHAFGQAETPDLGETHALVIVQHGRLVLERYGASHGPDTTCHSWSMAKSITQALTGVLTLDGKIDIHGPADAPEWRAPGDPRGAITLDLLLRMSSGLNFIEVYNPGEPSDVIEMLFGAAKADTAHFTADKPLAHAPGTFWFYSSGTTNIVCRALARAADAFGPDFEAFMRTRLFGPLGMTSAAPKFDGAGTFIGSSFCFCTPRDFARFGLLYLRGGVWENRRLLPQGWVDYARTPTPRQPVADAPYRAHWWMGMAGPGSFSANGHDGQYTVVIPDLDMVIVRNGLSAGIEKEDNVKAWIKALADCFR